MARGIFNPEHAVYGAEMGLQAPEEWRREEEEALSSLPPEPLLTLEGAQALALAGELRHDRPRLGGFGVEVGCYTLSVERRLIWRGYEPGTREFSLLEYLAAICVDEFIDREADAINSKVKDDDGGQEPPPGEGMGQS